MRRVRALAAALALLALVAGVPALLVATVGNPLTGWPDLAAGDLSDAVLVDVLAAVAYLAWAQFALAVITEALCLLTPLRSPARLVIVRASQRRLARTLIAAAFLLSPPTPALVLAAAAPPQVVAAAPAFTANPTLPPAQLIDARTASPPAAEPDAAPSRPTYTIRADGPGTYWDLAEHFLGDGQRWPEIWHLNGGRRQVDGAVMTSPGLLRPGWTVLLPASAGPSIDRTASVDAGTARGGGAGGEVTVQRGDSLWSIAESHLGKGQEWPELYRLNRNRPQPDGSRLTDPDLIRPGWILRLPAHHTGASGSPKVPPTPPGPPITPAPTIGQPTGQPTGTASPAPEPSTPSAATEPGATPRAEPTDRTQPAPAPHPGRAVGVDLPGGWVALPFAAAISAAGALVWLRRRRRYRYAPLEDVELSSDGLLFDDPDLQPLPAVVDRMRRAVREHAPHLLDPPAPRPTISEYLADPAQYRPPPLGPTGLDLAGLTDLANPAGLGLTGPGAAAAARALLVAVLSSGGPYDPDTCGHVIVPAPTLDALLGGEAREARDLPRLRVADDLADALTILDQEHLQRRQSLQEYDAESIAELRAADPTYPPIPPVILLADMPPGDLRGRLTAVTRLGAAVDISAVLLGEWPPGVTVELGADGTTTDGTCTRRAATLDIPGTIELLRVLREAPTGQPVPPPKLEAQEPPDPASHPDRSDPDDADAAVPVADASTTPALTGACRDPEDTLNPAAGAAADEGEPSLVLDPPRRAPIRVLGALAIHDANGQRVPGLRQHAGGLLAYLVIHRTGADKDDIMEALWPEASVRRAAERLSTEVGNLRRCLRQALGNRAVQPVLNTGGRYHLDPAVVEVDAWRFQDGLQAAVSATDPARRFAALEAAVHAHAGPLADGRDYHWLEPAREQFRRNGIRARLHLADLVSAAQPDRASELTEVAASLDPTNEELARLAMGAHARVDDLAAVAAQLRRLRLALREIDEEPSSETIALATQLQRRETSTRVSDRQIPAATAASSLSPGRR